jgi:hypothetical protein
MFIHISHLIRENNTFNPQSKYNISKLKMFDLKNRNKVMYVIHFNNKLIIYYYDEKSVLMESIIVITENSIKEYNKYNFVNILELMEIDFSNSILNNDHIFDLYKIIIRTIYLS